MSKSRCAPCRKYKTRKSAPQWCQKQCWMQYALNPKAKGTLHQYLGVPTGKTLPDMRLLTLRNNKNVPLHIRRRADVVLKMRGWRFKKIGNLTLSTTRMTHPGRFGLKVKK